MAKDTAAKRAARNRRTPPAEPPEVNGIVVKISRPEGEESGATIDQVVPSGDVKVAELPTLLELAAQDVRRRMGLGQS